MVDKDNKLLVYFHNEFTNRYKSDIYLSKLFNNQLFNQG